MKELRIVFMGTPFFAVGILDKLLQEKANVVGVITAPDKPSGRGRKLNQSAVKTFAESKQIPILQPQKLKDETFIEQLTALKADVFVVVAFRMLPEVVWKLPKLGTFNLHASLLPNYRGAAPINWAIINEEKRTGVTTFFIDEKIDTGAIIASSEINIEERETAGTLHDKLLELGKTLVVQTLHQIASGETKALPQAPNDDFKEAPKLTPENTKINWNQSSQNIDAHIRGLSPYPIAWSYLELPNEVLKVKIHQAEPVFEKHSNAIGSIHCTKNTIHIATKDGYISVLEIQLPGKKKLNANALLNGFKFPEGAKMR